MGNVKHCPAFHRLCNLPHIPHALPCTRAWVCTDRSSLLRCSSFLAWSSEFAILSTYMSLYFITTPLLMKCSHRVITWSSCSNAWAWMLLSLFLRTLMIYSQQETGWNFIRCTGSWMSPNFIVRPWGKSDFKSCIWLALEAGVRGRYRN